jgi:hypothetical protein
MLSPFSTRLFLSAEAAGSASEARRLLALEQYAALKFELLKNTAGIGAGLSAYLAVAQHDVSSGVSVAVGVGGALAYLVLLGRHVDGLRPGSVRGFKPQRNPGENIITVMLGAVQRVGDVYWCGSVVYVRPAWVRCADVNVLEQERAGAPAASGAGCHRRGRLGVERGGRGARPAVDLGAGGLPELQGGRARPRVESAQGGDALREAVRPTRSQGPARHHRQAVLTGRRFWAPAPRETDEQINASEALCTRMLRLRLAAQLSRAY